MKLDLVAIKKNDVYYVRDKGTYPQTLPDESRLMFDVDRRESFNDKWLVFDTLPTSAEHCIVGRDKLIGYNLKDGFQTTGQTPKSLPPTAFCCEDDECENTEIRGLYDSEYEKLPDVWEPVDMQIDFIDGDCAPLAKTKYMYHVDFPYYIECHDAVCHKYPCHIKADDAFKYIVTAVKENLPDHCYLSSDFDFHLGVDVRIPVLHDEKHVVDKSGWNARKPKWVEVPLREVRKTVINICTPRHSYGNVLSDVHADNYFELEKKMDEVIRSYVDLMQAKPVVCPRCKGHGWFVGDELETKQCA